MANRFEIRIEGLREIGKDLQKLPLRTRKKATLAALKVGAKTIQKNAKARAPRGKTGNLRRSIFLKNSKIKNGRRTPDVIGVFVGLRSFSRVKAGTARNAYYNRFVHDGYNARGTKREGNAKRGRRTNRGERNVAAKKFLTKAFKSKGRAAARISIRAADIATDKLLTRLGF